MYFIEFLDKLNFLRVKWNIFGIKALAMLMNPRFAYSLPIWKPDIPKRHISFQMFPYLPSNVFENETFPLFTKIFLSFGILCFGIRAKFYSEKWLKNKLKYWRFGKLKASARPSILTPNLGSSKPNPDPIFKVCNLGKLAETINLNPFTLIWFWSSIIVRIYISWEN